MVNLIKVIKHIRKVGFKQFREEFKQGQKQLGAEEKVALRMQTQGYTGVLLFSLVTGVIFAWNGFWTIAGIFMFSMLIVLGNLKTTVKELKKYTDIEKAMKQALPKFEQKGDKPLKEEKRMRNITLDWEIEGLENGFIVKSLETDNKKFFENLEDAKEHVKKQIDKDCEAEFEE